MTHTFLKGDRVSIEATVTEVARDGSVLTRIAIDTASRDCLVRTAALTLVERPVTLPTNPYEYGPDPETGRPRWEVQVYADGRGWRDVRGVSSRVGVWHFDVAGGWVSPMGKWPVRPVA